MKQKVVSFGVQIPQQRAARDAEVVYRDINRASDPNYKNKRPEITDSKYWMFTTLAQEHPGTYRADDLVLTEQERAGISLLYGVNYEQFQHDFDLFLKMKPWVVSSSVNMQAIHNSLDNIFNWIPGERVLNPEFGSDVRRMLYEGITPQNIERIVAEIHHSISEWEPRVQIQNIVNVTSDDDAEDNTVHLELIYTVPGLSEEQMSYSIYTKK